MSERWTWCPNLGHTSLLIAKTNFTKESFLPQDSLMTRQRMFLQENSAKPATLHSRYQLQLGLSTNRYQLQLQIILKIFTDFSLKSCGFFTSVYLVFHKKLKLCIATFGKSNILLHLGFPRPIWPQEYAERREGSLVSGSLRKVHSIISLQSS